MRLQTGLLQGSLSVELQDTPDHLVYTGLLRASARDPLWRTTWTALALEVGKSPTATPRRAELPVA